MTCSLMSVGKKKKKKYISLRAHLGPFSFRSHLVLHGDSSLWHFILTFCYHKHSYSWLLQSMPVNQLGYTILERQLSRDLHEGNMVCDLPEEKYSRIESGTWKGTWRQVQNKGSFTQLGSASMRTWTVDFTINAGKPLKGLRGRILGSD